jgi:hypothetical protein
MNKMIVVAAGNRILLTVVFYLKGTAGKSKNRKVRINYIQISQVIFSLQRSSSLHGFVSSMRLRCMKLYKQITGASLVFFILCNVYKITKII